MKLVTLAFLATTLTAGVALAQSPTDMIVANMGDVGYTNIEVETHGQTLQVSATKNGQVRELVYDARTGQLLSERIDANGDGELDTASEHSGADDHGTAANNDNGADDSGSKDGDSGSNYDDNGGTDRNNGSQSDSGNDDRDHGSESNSGGDRDNDDGRDND